MYKNCLRLPLAALMVMATSGTAFATDLNIEFTASVLETTCQMKLDNGVGSDTDQTLQIGSATNGVRIADFGTSKNREGGAGAQATFWLRIVECPASLNSLKTTITGTPSGYLKTALKNEIPVASGGADFAAISVARLSTPTAAFEIGSTDDAKRLVWTNDDINVNKGVQLVAIMQATQDGNVTTGTFEATATFEFSYE